MWVVCPRLLLLFNLARLPIIYIVPMSYCISHNSDISNQVRNKNKGAYPSNSIRFSVAFRRFFSKCLRPPTPDSFPFIHKVKKKTPKGLDIIPHIKRALPRGRTSSGKIKFSCGWSAGAIQARRPSFKRIFLV